MADDTSTDQGDDDTDDAPAQPAGASVKDAADTVPPEVTRALRKANKEAQTLRQKLQEYEDRDKTDQQRLTERAEAAERERDSIRTEVLRARVALSKRLPTELVDRLRGDSEEELAQDADRLLTLLGGQTASRGSADQGVRGAAKPKDMNALIRSSASRR